MAIAFQLVSKRVALSKIYKSDMRFMSGESMDGWLVEI
jgi:hypothetical protein